MGDYCKSTLEVMTVDWDIVISGVTAADDDDGGGDGEAAVAAPVSPRLFGTLPPWTMPPHHAFPNRTN